MCWTSRLQKATATYTTEAEFAALSVCAKDISWIREVLHELSAEERGPTTLRQDNLGCINWIESVQDLRNVRHVGIKYHLVRYLVISSVINVAYFRTDDNRADSLNKILGRAIHSLYLSKLGMPP